MLIAAELDSISEISADLEHILSIAYRNRQSPVPCHSPPGVRRE